jgi:hypothetical protein
MSPYILRTSRPHESILPLAHTDPNHRLYHYGPIRPMDEPGFFRRLFRLR